VGTGILCIQNDMIEITAKQKNVC